MPRYPRRTSSSRSHKLNSNRKFNSIDPIGNVDYVTRHIDTTSTFQSAIFIIVS